MCMSATVKREASVLRHLGAERKETIAWVRPAGASEAQRT